MGNCVGMCTAEALAEGFDLHGENDPRVLAKGTHFKEDEIYALFELFRKVSSSVIADGLIHKDEFSLAIFNTSKSNLFVDRVFELFDVKQNGVIDFSEFVCSLSVFHPIAPVSDKADFAFKIYDLKKTGVIEKDEVHNLLVALLHDNPNLRIPREAIAELVERTFEEVSTSKTGVISRQEWYALVSHNPGVIGYMTLPILKELTTRFPNFVFSKHN